ncbi:MAG: SusC/RagA family TonB-linked outer membrane protein [Prevotella sp.]|jgi:TonB-linked SusC/RagA family outer membrane protein|nr:SusC/RagA family TonB-linked outer membrane protein [Prevotella sp.]MCI2088578.1 SusC/RagA family TonB-linked outer membrane protein [Prevotella sp.]MCI2126148.1 SusC/RagA family TonB-linked outer membrane protein [Prevotella sp.]
MKKCYSLPLLFCFLFGLPIKALTHLPSENINEILQQDKGNEKRISGSIVDKSGEPVIGASVRVAGTHIGAVTNVDGQFFLDVPPGSKLDVSYLGYIQKEIKITDAQNYKIVLEENSHSLNEVVVTAMGIKKDRKALGYSVSNLNSSELLKNKSTNVINSLDGKIPGLNITQSGGSAGAGANIVIRGGNSASETRDNQPLFVVDGIIYDNSTVNSGNSNTDGVSKTSTTFSNRIMDINPEDIENVSVLKGAAAAALYGSRAGNGVIIITTKKGKEGSIRINVDSKYTYSWANRLPDIQKVYGRGYYNEAGTFSDYTTQSWGKTINGKAYNNLGDFFQGGNIFDNSVSVSGGGKTNSFYLSGSNYNQTGIVPTTNFGKTTFRFNGEQRYGDFLKVGAGIAYSQANTKKTLTSGGLYGQGGNGVLQAVYGWSPSDNMKHYLNEDGSKYRMFEGLQDLQDDVENPYWILNKNKIKDETSRFTGSLYADLKLTSWWNVTARAGIDKYTTDSYTYEAPEGALLEKYQNGFLSKSREDYQYISTNVMSNMDQTLGNFDFNLLLGTTAEDTKILNNTEWGYDFVSPGVVSFSNMATADQFLKDQTIRKRLVGVYGEFRASYKSLAYLTVTGRNDWSSTLPVKNQSYFYPSVSGSFVFSELIPKNNILSFGKLRASWAQVGKDADPYSTSFYLWPVATVNGGKLALGNSWTGGSYNLKPEIQTAYELGTELHFLNGRLGLDYTYYYSKTKNQICSPRLTQSTGYIFLTLNGGSVTNKGMELAITGKPILTRDFQWETTLSLSGNRGRLGKFIDGVGVFYVTDAQVGGAKAGSIPNGYFQGLTGNEFVTAKGNDGTEHYIVDETTGLYKDSKVYTNVVGNREPTMIGGLNNSLTYKNFNLSFLLDLRLGGDIYNGTEYYLVSNGLSKKTLNRKSVTVSGVSSTTGDEITYTYEAGKSYNVNGAVKSGEYMIQQYWQNYCLNAYNFITKTNWIRLRSISLSYDLKDFLRNQHIIKGLVATLTGTNLLLITNYKGLDPEVSAAGSGTGGSGSSGIDYCGVPSTAGVSFGVNITF